MIHVDDIVRPTGSDQNAFFRVERIRGGWVKCSVAAYADGTRPQTLEVSHNFRARDLALAALPPRPPRAPAAPTPVRLTARQLFGTDRPADTTTPKHTPGPWASGPTGNVMKGYSQPFAVVQRGEANLVAGVFGDVRGGEAVAKANARLIAAAPELLEHLRVLSAEDSQCASDWVKKKEAARAAIAKAEGLVT
jgi:hypothetical protein